MNKTLKNQIEKSLASVFSDLKTEKKTLEFLNNFLTEKELETLSKRLSVAYWLSKKRSYENIKTNLSVSSATIAQTNNLLDKKPIKLALKNLDANEWAEKRSSQIRKLLNLINNSNN